MTVYFSLDDMAFNLQGHFSNECVWDQKIGSQRKEQLPVLRISLVLGIDIDI